MGIPVYNVINTASKELTKEQIVALRKADSVSFRSQKNNNISIDAVRQIRKNGKLVREDDYTIPVTTNLNEHFECFSMIHASQLDPNWLSITSTLRVGDKLSLVWNRGGHTTQHLESAGFAGDSLELQIKRKDSIKYQFIIAVEVGKANSTSRMIRDKREVKSVMD
jgi:hypothetical protein